MLNHMYVSELLTHFSQHLLALAQVSDLNSHIQGKGVICECEHKCVFEDDNNESISFSKFLWN